VTRCFCEPLQAKGHSINTCNVSAAASPPECNAGTRVIAEKTSNATYDLVASECGECECVNSLIVSVRASGRAFESVGNARACRVPLRTRTRARVHVRAYTHGEHERYSSAHIPFPFLKFRSRTSRQMILHWPSRFMPVSSTRPPSRACPAQLKRFFGALTLRMIGSRVLRETSFHPHVHSSIRDARIFPRSRRVPGIVS